MNIISPSSAKRVKRREQCQIFVVIVVRISHRVNRCYSRVFLVEAVSAWHLHGPYSDCAWHTPFRASPGLLPATAWVAFKMWTLGFCDRAPPLYRRFSISIRRWAACGSDCSLSHLSASIRQQFSWTDSDSDSYGILVATVRALFAPSAANLKFVRALDHAAATAFERSALIDDSITLTHAISTPALGQGVPAPFIVTCAATQLKSCGVGQAASSLLPSWL